MRSPSPQLLRVAEVGDAPTILVGTRDAVTARMVLDAGFDGGWVSSLEISAITGVQDCNLLSVDVVAAVVRAITLAVPLPLLVDADNCYGSVSASARTVRVLAAAGAAGMCIEDSAYPKQNSFTTGTHRNLVALNDFADCINAAVAARPDPAFLVVGRTETLTVGLPLSEALQRARTIASAGADLVLLHSTDPTGAEARAVAAQWTGEVPLVIVPTAFPHLDTATLGKLGYSMVIYANQSLRAAIHATRVLLRALGETGSAETDMVTMPELLELMNRFDDGRDPRRR